MNTIRAEKDRSDYNEDFEYLNFKIEGRWLDELLEELYPGRQFKGLIPTLMYMNREDEQALVWQRILPEEGERKICPILMCPDDCEFFCTLIVAEIENWGSTVLWNRIGLNTTISNNPEAVGLNVEWFQKIGMLEFEGEEYETMLEAFRNYEY
ncbi:MAG TPA: hypothetical protein VNB90_16820 [Cytophagaceae bacterium]|nr:hypothetical protein [Cytophagaceae bacterium]